MPAFEIIERFNSKGIPIEWVKVDYQGVKCVVKKGTLIVQYCDVIGFFEDELHFDKYACTSKPKALSAVKNLRSESINLVLFVNTTGRLIDISDEI